MPSYTIDRYGLQLEQRTVLLFLRSGTTVRGWVIFHEDGVALPSASIDSNNRITLHLFLSRFASVLDILRNENPIFLYYNGADSAGLSTGALEPVGEGEA